MVDDDAVSTAATIASRQQIQGGEARKAHPTHPPYVKHTHALDALRTALKAVKAHMDAMGLRPDQCAVVLDIDQTLIFKKSSGELPRIMKNLYNRLRAVGFHVHLITAREGTPEVATFTRKELKAHGYSNWISAWLCPGSMRKSFKDIAEFKKRARAHVTRKYGRPVVLTIGDNFFDHMSQATLSSLPHEASSYPHFLVFFVNKPDEFTAVCLKLPPDA